MTRAGSSMVLVPNLVSAFRSAIRAVAPIVHNIGIQWLEPDNYQEWDAIASGIYDGIVLKTIVSSASWRGYFPIISYDKRVASYERYSYICDESGGSLSPIVCFETNNMMNPFDTCVLCRIYEDGGVASYFRSPFENCNFVFAGRRSAGNTVTMSEIVW